MQDPVRFISHHNLPPSMESLAIVTQSYRNDIRECALLCESIKRFVPGDIPHHIFVNDEDFRLFKENPAFKGRHIHRKSEIMPWHHIQFPFKVLGHRYLVSPFTIPVREWIVQQICKLGAFEALGSGIEAIMNIDSECVFLRPLESGDLIKDGKWILFKGPFIDEPCHDEYCRVARRFMPLPPHRDIIGDCYMSHPVVFVRENIEALLQSIASSSIFKSWKHRLCNTYRFSEYYCYGLFSDHVLGLKNHFLTDKHLFPLVDITHVDGKKALMSEIRHKMTPGHTPLGVWLQKSNRNSASYLPFNDIHDTILEYWEQRQ